MATSKTRVDWALLLLRTALGLGFLLHAIPAVRYGSSSPTFANAGHWFWVLAELVGGSFMLLGLWMPWVCLPLLLVIGEPLVHGWLHGEAPLARPDALVRLLTLLASALGGPGKWALGKD